LVLAPVSVCAQALTGPSVAIATAPPPPPASSLPATQTINFGAKTLVGEGGSPMQYATPALLNVTRVLAITSETDKNGSSICNSRTTCLTSANVQIDGRQMLTPKNGVLAYKSAWSGSILSTCGAPGDPGNCTVTVTEYTCDPTCSSYSSATGITSVITMPILDHAAHAREMTAAGRGCQPALNICATTTADGGSCNPTCGTNSDTTFQLNDLLTTGSAICLGDTIYLRDAGNNAISPTKFNPNQLRYGIRPIASYSCGSGRITIQSETVDSTDALQHGFRFGPGAFDINTTFTTTSDIPIDLKYLYCLGEISTAVIPSCQTYNSTTQGGGVGVYYMRCEMTAPALPLLINCTKSNGDGVIDHNYAIGTGKAFASNAQNVNPPPAIGGGNMTITNNRCAQIQDDCIDIIGLNNDVEYNFMWNPAGCCSNHIDFIQGVGTNAAGDFGTIAHNFYLPNDNTLAKGEWPQCVFLQNPNPANQHQIYTNAQIYDNGCFTPVSNSYAFSYMNNPSLRHSIALFIAGSAGAQFNANVNFDANVGCCGATIKDVLVNAFNTSLQPPTVTLTNTKTLANNDVSGYQTALPHFIAGDGPVGVTTWNQAVTYFAPANTAVASGGLKNPDGTFIGPLLPVNNGGEICWAEWAGVDIVFDTTKTCAQMGSVNALR
jgi:hypothetical protein